MKWYQFIQNEVKYVLVKEFLGFFVPVKWEMRIFWKVVLSSEICIKIRFNQEIGLFENIWEIHQETMRQELDRFCK